MKLYEIQEDQSNILQQMMVIANDFELKGEERDQRLEKLQRNLNMLTGRKTDKILNIAVFIKNIKSDVEQLKEETRVLQAKKKRYENKIEYLEWLLMNNIDVGEEFEDSRVRISWRKSSKLKIDEGTENDLPETYKEYILKVLKRELKQDIKSGKISPVNARIIQMQNLQIK